MSKKLLSGLLGLAAVFTLVPAAHAIEPEVTIYGQGSMSNFVDTDTCTDDTFQDVSPLDHWASPSIAQIYDYGIMKGVAEHSFAPKKAMSLGEAVTIVARIRSTYYQDGELFARQEGHWSRPYSAYLERAGALPEGWIDSRVEEPATRAEFCYLIAQALPPAEFPQINEIADDSLPDVRSVDDYAEPIYQLYRAGVLTGMDGKGTFHPQGKLERAHVATIVVRVIEAGIRRALLPGGSSIPQEGKSYLTVTNDQLSLTMGMAASALPPADEELFLKDDLVWHLYGIKDQYKNGLLCAGVYDGQVVALAVSGPGWSCGSMEAGSVTEEIILPDSVFGDVFYTQMADRHDGDKVHSMVLRNPKFSTYLGLNPTTLVNECAMNFHLTNAFRAIHGLAPLKWDQAAAEAARLHSEDMLRQDYFDHIGLDGRDPGQRMSAQGIHWSTGAENIAAGQGDSWGIHDAWVNSAGHRANLLKSGIRYMGVGAAIDGGTYGNYWTQSFWG